MYKLIHFILVYFVKNPQEVTKMRNNATPYPQYFLNCLFMSSNIRHLDVTSISQIGRIQRETWK